MIFERHPKLCVVVPDIPNFPFSMRESWRVSLQNAKIPIRWISHVQGRPERTVRGIGRQDLVILLNDHHLGDLTEFLGKQGHIGRGLDERIWLGIATERVVGSLFPRGEEKTRACARLCHLVAHFDPLAAGLIELEGARSLFMHQYVDAITYRTQISFEKKQPCVFWVGKLARGTTAGEYDQRNRLFETVKNLSGFVWREACRPDLPIHKIVCERDQYQVLLHLPSNCPGYTATFFEHLAMGGVVLQYLTGTQLPQGLRAEQEFLAYDPMEPSTLLETILRVIENPSRFASIAARGRLACLRHHTLFHRIQSLLQRCQTLALAAGHPLSQSLVVWAEAVDSLVRASESESWDPRCGGLPLL